MDLKITTHPRGYITAEMPKGDPIKVRLGFTELADADQLLGRSLLSLLASDPMNLHGIRVAIYFGAQEINKGIRSVRHMSRLLEGAELKYLAEIVNAALRVSGVYKDNDSDGTSESEAGEDEQGEA